MKKRSCFRRALALVLALALLLGAVSCGQGERKETGDSARATSMYLRKTQGTVSVEDDDGRELKPQEDLGLYDGYLVGTEDSSYAWIDLDKTKLTKLDEDSEVEIQRKRDDLELTVSRGGLYFNITQPLDEDESLTIRTSTMTVGIRGTCGWVRMESRQELAVYILEGTVECSVTGEDGKILSTTVTAGERARILRLDGTADIQVERMEPDQVPQFVLDELEEDEDLRQAIQSASGLDLGGGGGGAFRVEDLANVSYTGDLSLCAMTARQAGAFAQVLEECLEELDGLETWGGEPFLRTALFDAGDGIPILWVVMGSHVYPGEDGYIPSVNRFYQWDGSRVSLADTGEHRNYLLNAYGLVLNDYYPEAHMRIYNSAELRGLDRGQITSEPWDILEDFGLFQPEKPTTEELRVCVERDSVYDQFYDYDSAYRIQKLGEDDVWRVLGYKNLFFSPETAIDWHGAPTLLGHGRGGHQDVGWDWYGAWSSGEEMLAALTGGTDSLPESIQPRFRTTSVYDPASYIRHTEVDTGELELELYYEIPVFPDTSKGYQAINRFFQELEDSYFAQGGEAETMIQMVQEIGPDFLYTVYFASTYDAMVHTNDGGLVSVTLFYYYDGGGVHPSHGQTGYTFRADTGELLKLTDLIDGTEDEIRTMIADALEPEYELDEYERGNVLNFNLEHLQFYVEDGSVWVIFNPYDISYYARGAFLARLPAPLKPLS